MKVMEEVEKKRNLLKAVARLVMGLEDNFVKKFENLIIFLFVIKSSTQTFSSYRKKTKQIPIIS